MYRTWLNGGRSMNAALWCGAVMMVSALHSDARAATEWAEPEKVTRVEAGELTAANVLWWGFDEEDSTRYVQAAIDSGAAKVIIPLAGQDWIVRPITMTQDDQTILFENGVVVQAKEGAIRNRGTRLFEAIGRRNITFSGYGATLRMGRDEQFIREYHERGRRGGDLICILGSEEVLIEGLHLVEAWNDGIYVGRGGGQDYSRNITVRHVVADSNHRQGMSIVSVDGMLVEHSVFKNTRGGAPMAGIDCETHNERERLSNVVIRHNLFLNNSQLGMHNWPSRQTDQSAPVSILWENNYVRGSAVGIQVAAVNATTPPGEIVFRNNVIEGSSFAGILIRRAGLSQLKVRFEGNVLMNTAHEIYDDEEDNRFYREIWPGRMENAGDWYGQHGVPAAPIVFTAQSDNKAWQGNISFDNDLIISDLDGPMVVIQGPWGVDHAEMFGRDPEDTDEQFLGWANITGTLRVLNPNGGRIEKRAPVRDFDLQLKLHTGHADAYE